MKKTEEIKLLSVVIPSYKQEKNIVENIQQMIHVLSESHVQFEIIVVVDGMLDKTYENAKKVKHSSVRVVGYKENQGKGNAVRYGMLKAKGDVVGFMDGGMDIDPTGIDMLLNHMDWYGADIIVGSKMHPVSQINYPVWRRILSRGYRLLTWSLFGFKVRDTQVGIKFMKRNVVQDVLPLLLVKRYAFDVELLAVAYRRGYTRIYEAPVRITFTQNSILVKDLWRVLFLMMWDTAAVFYRLKILHYYDKKRKVRKK